MATRNARSKMKEMNENMGNSQSFNNNTSAKEEAYNRSASKTSSSKGDYIDFEEIK